MRCRNAAKKPRTWTELVDSGMDEDEVVLAMLKASLEVIEDQEREIAELKARLNEG